MKIELRNNTAVITGYVNVTEKRSRPILTPHGKVVEIIKEGTFRRAIGKADIVSLTVDHNQQNYASTKDNTLELVEDNIGLFAKAKITDSNLIKLARENKIKGWSFGMRNIVDELDSSVDPPLRSINDFDMDHITLVVDKEPAYTATSVELRAGEEITVETRAFANDVIVETSKNDIYKSRLEKVLKQK